MRVLAVSCEQQGSELQVSDVKWTPCKQVILRSSALLNDVAVEFNDKGIRITCNNFGAPCDFTTVNVTHTLVNGVLNITQQGFPNQAKCVCYTDVSYTINGILQREVNVIFINGVEVYCHNEKEQNCDRDVIISRTEYENAPNSPVSIIDVKLVDNCLKIKFASSGCSGNTWVVKLIGDIYLTWAHPPLWSLRLSLDNKEMCDALITKEVSFNIEGLQISGNEVMLVIHDKFILYAY